MSPAWQSPSLVETSKMLLADKGKLGKLQLLVISLMLPWGLPTVTAFVRRQDK